MRAKLVHVKRITPPQPCFVHIFTLKFVKILAGPLHCSIALLCASRILHVSANNFTNVSITQTELVTVAPFTSTLAAHNVNAQQHTQQFIALWANVSKYLLWATILISLVSIMVLLQALILMLTHYRRSNYFDFMSTMIILDLIMLTSIILNLLYDSLFSTFDGVCKLTAFLTNVARCYVNWLWVMMFCQRFANIYFSIHRSKHSGLSFFEDSRKLLVYTGIVSIITNLWVPFLMTEVRISTSDGSVVASICSQDQRVLNPDMVKWIAAAESLWIYVMPFLITVFTDFAVLFFTRESKWFTTVSLQTIKQNDGQIPLSLKIQSEESIKAANKRRRFAIRRCLALATTQLCLNLPYHFLQLVDEFTNLRTTSKNFSLIYLYSDALFYLLYLIQFPLIAVFVRLLHSNYDNRSQRRSQSRRQRTFNEDAHSSATHSGVGGFRNKRCSYEPESIAVLTSHPS